MYNGDNNVQVVPTVNIIGPSSLNQHNNIDPPEHPVLREHIEKTEMDIKGSKLVAKSSIVEGEDVQQQIQHRKMKSGLFLILHTITSTLLLSGCAIYISVTRENLSDSSSNALILPQILAVVPGFFFTLSRSVLFFEDSRPIFVPRKAWKILLIILSAILAILAYGSVIPAVFWSLLWTVSGAAVDLFEDIADAT